MGERLDKIRHIIKKNFVKPLSKSKGVGVAAILARHHERMADKYAYSNDNKTFYKHVRAAKRFHNITIGKKVFSESRVHGRYKIGDKISTKIGKKISGHIESLDGNYVHFRNREQNETNPKGKLYRTHLTNILLLAKPSKLAKKAKNGNKTK